MGDIESPHRFAENYLNALDADERPQLAKRIEARDTDVANQARVTVLTELRAAYWSNRDTSWEAECVRLLEKYGAKDE